MASSNSAIKWEEQIGGYIGEEFKKIIRNGDRSALASFVKNYPFQAKVLLNSYAQHVGKLPIYETRPSILFIVILYFLLLAVIPATAFVFLGFRLKKQTLGAKTETVEVKGPKLALLENADLGYKFYYPEEFKVITTNDGVELDLFSGKGKIMVSAKDGIMSASIIDADWDSSEEMKKLDEAVGIIQQNFKFNNL